MRSRRESTTKGSIMGDVVTGSLLLIYVHNGNKRELCRVHTSKHSFHHYTKTDLATCVRLTDLSSRCVAQLLWVKGNSDNPAVRRERAAIAVQAAEVVASIIIIIFIKCCQNATFTKINNSLYTTYTHHKIITEELVAFVNKLSVACHLALR